MKGLGEETDVDTRINEAAGGSFKDLQDKVEGFIATQQQLALAEINRGRRQEEFHRYGKLVSKHLTERIELERKNAAIQAKLLEVESLRMQLAEGNLVGPAARAAARQLELREAELIALREAKEGYERDISHSSKLGLQAIHSLESGLASAFDGLVMGTKTVKEAFRDMAMGVIQSLSKMLAEMMAARIMMTAFGFGTSAPPGGTGFTPGAQNTMSNLPGQGFPSGSLSITPGNKLGGILKDGSQVYAGGGVARGPRSGYPAILHGTEAVVPLPGGRAIPVQMNGGANNITVNISGEGATSTEGGDQEGLGRAIAMAVQKELQNQKRSGGILNPYGAA